MPLQCHRLFHTDDSPPARNKSVFLVVFALLDISWVLKRQKCTNLTTWNRLRPCITTGAFLFCRTVCTWCKMLAGMESIPMVMVYQMVWVLVCRFECSPPSSSEETAIYSTNRGVNTDLCQSKQLFMLLHVVVTAAMHPCVS